jgi:GAF domain-containing protein
MNDIASYLGSGYSPNEDTAWHFRRPGPPLEEVERVRAVLELAGTLTGWSGVPSRHVPLDLATAESALAGAQDATAECLRRGGPSSADDVARANLVALLTSLGQARLSLRDAVLAHRAAAQSHMLAALQRLREVSTVRGLVERAPQELNALGFDRGLVSRIRNSRWVTETCFVENDPEFAEVIVQAGRADPVVLEQRLLETEMVRTGRPILVREPEQSPRVHHSLRKATETRSYVAAPIICDGRRFGFAHADGFRDPRKLDTFDRDTIGMFAEGLGYAMERTLLAERLLGLRNKINEYSGTVTDLIDRFVESDLQRRTRWRRYRAP